MTPTVIRNIRKSILGEQQRVYQTDAYGRIQHNKPSSDTDELSAAHA